MSVINYDRESGIVADLCNFYRIAFIMPSNQRQLDIIRTHFFFVPYG